MILVLLLALVFFALAVGLALRATGGDRQPSDVLAQVGAYGFHSRPVAAALRTNPFQSGEIASAIGARVVGRVRADHVRDVRQLLNSAGYYRTTVTRYLGYRVLAVILPAALALFGIAAGRVGIVAGTLLVMLVPLGWVLPKTLVERAAKKRTQGIDYEVPELVDLLVTMIEGGVGLGAALQLAAGSVREPLGSELRLTLGEQSIGLTMDEALRNMLERTNRSGSMRAFVQAITQGESLGVSIGKTLRDLAVDMRKRRRQAAEERAQKAPIKLLFPLTFLILPAMLIVILGPAVRALVHGLG